MNKKSYYLFTIFIVSISIFLIELIYLNINYSISPIQKSQKKKFVQLTMLPDLALINEAFYIRHRSFDTIFTIYPDDPLLLEYFPSTFVYVPYILNIKKD